VYVFEWRCFFFFSCIWFVVVVVGIEVEVGIPFNFFVAHNCFTFFCVVVVVAIEPLKQVSSAARFQLAGCSAAIAISEDLTQATYRGHPDATHVAARVLCTRPSPQADGSLVVRFRLDAAVVLRDMPFVGWAIAGDSELTSLDTLDEMGCFLGLDPDVSTRPPLAVGDVLTLRYHPAHGVVSAQVNGAAAFDLYSGLPTQHDESGFVLVPAVVLRHVGDVVSLLPVD
jgi:hypothetical protein